MEIAGHSSFPSAVSDYSSLSLVFTISLLVLISFSSPSSRSTLSTHFSNSYIYSAKNVKRYDFVYNAPIPAIFQCIRRW